MANKATMAIITASDAQVAPQYLPIDTLHLRRPLTAEEYNALLMSLDDNIRLISTEPNGSNSAWEYDALLGSISIALTMRFACRSLKWDIRSHQNLHAWREWIISGVINDSSPMAFQCGWITGHTLIVLLVLDVKVNLNGD